MAISCCNAQTSETFLQSLLDEYDDQHLLVIVDHFPFHRAWFLPPYSPELNLIERVWK